MKKQLCIYPLIVLFFFTTGCAAVLIGAGVAAGGAGVVWYKGKLEQTLSATVPRVHAAVKAGLSDLNISIKEERHDNLISKVRGELADGTKVWIDAASTSASTTTITVRVGYMGDKTFSLRILDSIKKHL